jgi:glycolate oxidase FAD binding subunit
MTLRPGSEAEVAEAIRASIAECSPLAVEGGGTRSGLGRHAPADHVLSMRELTGITLYEPAEMVIGAWAGTPLPLLERTLADRGQMLAFEPMDHRPLFGTDGEPSIGAIAACNISGPRRVMAGACRDSLIGVRFVNGTGEIVKNGGRVMKNVTGLDLVKLQAGAFGTLGVLTEVIFKVVPRPAQVATVELSGLGEARAVEALSSALGSPFEPTGAAHLPAGVAGPTSRTLIRIEGFPEQIAYRSAALRERLRTFGPLFDASVGQEALWAAVRDASFLSAPATDAVWRLSVPPGVAASVVAAVSAALTCRHYLDWGGGLIRLATPETGDAGQSAIRAAVRAAGGHGALVRGSAGLRSRIDVFQPLEGPLAAVQKRLKEAFDPARMINPGRMYVDV